MKKKLIFLFCLLAGFCKAQVICINCYDQNARVLTDSNNLILNGGFENTTCIPYLNSGYGSYCPNSSRYNCSISNWICTGGGSNTYADICDSAFSTIVEGTKAVYFGNYYCNACSSNASDTSCISITGCEVTGIPSGYPLNSALFGGDIGVSLSQTINNLATGANYLLEFWSGGEGESYTREGLFAVDVGFGNIFLRDPPTPLNISVGRRYIVEFTAVSSSHTIKFTNWGHIGQPDCSELVLDDVRLFRASEATNPCAIGITELSQNAALSFYPNPVSSNSLITFTSPSTSVQREIVLNNIDGKEVGRYALPQGNSEYHVKLPKLAAGVYVARLISNIQFPISNIKFVVE